MPNQLTCLSVPEFDVPVVTAAQKPSAIVAEVNGSDSFGVAKKRS